LGVSAFIGLSQLRERNCACAFWPHGGDEKSHKERKRYFTSMILTGGALPITRGMQVGAVSLWRMVEHSKGQGRGEWIQCLESLRPKRELEVMILTHHWLCDLQ
jgi:hypothetical protein